ncbi:MAG TPA: DinB family protein [Candidatus Eisenbacteria bacterium]|nr:DinB family protein [Candidatus Eisenbacteria bacterium]
MNWTDLLRNEVETAYGTTARLLDKVDPDGLDWKPATGSNWMTVGQLIKHISNACGAGCKGFVLADWGLPAGKKLEDLSPEENLPPAEKLPTVESVDEAKKLLAEDKAIALQMIDQAGENDLATRQMAVPWEPSVSLMLGHHLLRMIQHLDRHKSQLFYYLKLQGKSVHTGDLWG